MTRTAFFAAFFCLLAAFFMPSCSSKQSNAMLKTESAAEVEMDEDVAYADFSSAKGVSGSGFDAEESDSVVEPSLSHERKLIRTGRVRIEVSELSPVKGKISSWVKRYGGYVSNSDEMTSSVTFTVKIPSEHFDEAMGETSSFGKVVSKSISSRDVTEQYYDLKTRLETKRLMLEKLETYLRAAKDLKDMLQIEEKTNEVTSELESMQGQMNRLSSQIAFSEISVTAFLRANRTENGFSTPDIGEKFSDFLGNIVNFLAGFLFALLYIIVFGIPILFAVALFYWLCFGKIGLVRKLFRKLKK